MSTPGNRGATIDIGHHIVSLLVAKPRTPPELARLTEASRQTVWRHLKSLETHQLVVRAAGHPAIYSWHKR